MENNLTFGIAFFAGLASFLSPCVFALVPAYVSYLSGRSAGASGAEQEKNSAWETLSHGLAFVGGFTFVFVAVGALLGLVSGLLSGISDLLVKVGGVVVVIFGLHMMRIIRISFLDYDLRPQTAMDRKKGYASSAMMGVFFSAGWSPCVGPVLGLIYTLTFNGGSISQGAGLLLAYSAGLGIPFLFAATQIGWVTSTLRKHGKIMHYVEIAMGVVMVVIGTLLFIGRYESIIASAATNVTFGAQEEEVIAGKLMLWGTLFSVIAGLLPGYIAKFKGKNFTDWWFIGTGISLLLIVGLYAVGLLDSLLPFIS
jgi:cytochrome c-type biogenesis protein